MNSKIFFPKLLDLQLFAEGTGGDGGTGAEGATGVTATAAVSQRKGAKSNPLASVQYGVQTEGASPAAEVTQPSAEDRAARFKALVEGEFKDLFDARMQDAVQRRVKSTKETVDRYNALTPTLEILARKYGVDATDTEALTKAIEEDDSYFEDEALEKGITVEELKRIRKIERENADLRRQVEEKTRRDNAAQQYAAWMKQAEDAKKTYPSLNLEAEIKNPQFVRLLNAGVDVATAFTVIHRNEIIPAAMQYTAQTVEKKIASSVAANGSRPTENGISSQSASLSKSDVTTLTKADRAEIMRRVARGEKISFG